MLQLLGQGTDGALSLSPGSHGEPVSCHLSPVTINRHKECCTEKKYQLVFFSTAGLGNDVKTTLSLINVICRDR